MPTKIKHSAITSQTDLHEPKLHTESHKYNGVDPVVIEDDYTYELSTKKVLQPNGANRALWTDALTTNTVAADTTIVAGTGITATTGNVAASSGNITASGTITSGTNLTATNGDIESTAADKGLFLGANATNGTYEFRRHQQAGVNFPLLTKRVGGSYVARPHQFAVQHSSTVYFNADADQTDVCWSTVLQNNTPQINSTFTTTGTPSWTLGGAVSVANYNEIRRCTAYLPPWPQIVPYSCYVYVTTGFYRSAGSGSAIVWMMKAPCDSSTADLKVVGTSSVTPTATSEFKKWGTATASVTGDEASLADDTTLDKSKVAEGEILFPLFQATDATLKGWLYYNVELIPCN